MVRFKHLIPVSLNLSVGIAAVASSSSLSSPAILAGQARNALADDIARLHQSVRRARSIIEIRDADVSVSTSKLQEILGDIKGLEKQVTALLRDGAGAGANDDAKQSSQSSDENNCHGSADQVGSDDPSRGKANCSMKAGSAARKPEQKSARQTSGPSSSPAARASSDDGALTGAVFDEASGSKTSTSSSVSSLAASKYDSESTDSGRNSDISPKGSADDEASASAGGSSSQGGKGKVSHDTSSNKTDEESGPAPPSATEEDDSAPVGLMKSAPGETTPRFLTARPAKAPQQAVVTRKPVATGSASPKDGTRNAGPMTMSLREELTTTTITRTGSSRTTVKITKTRTKTIWMDWRTKSSTTKASRTPAKTKPATSPTADEADRDMDRDTERVATRAPNFSHASPNVLPQQLAGGLQRFSNSTIKLYVPLKAERVLFSGHTMAAETPTSLTRVKAAPPAMATRKRLTLPPSAGSARTSSPPPSGFKTIATKASKRPNETRK
ncbi:hypothetical protein HRG_009253 [Hirsutella rhossiliensis]|uniref:Uncharacterized protein n=1 Tax=Hirsutella rhossiliensis TaxID=111463 RepID=A0A9P8MSL8_9HYPO|nr:uncharacterized protein HRG_09253 [Hirsutella rhossiliensis]KAH0959471.1 hypothetical protein HRG_09253 [Hirsutella rhossiliensis]